ncbi:MAG: cytochrome c family protein [Paracoccaceae bacterium]|nr:cytochrome c family protein [Paracoccaceae bacterium]
MLDTMTATKIVGGFCGMLLIFLLGSWVAETIYHTGGHGYGDHHEQAYTIDTGEEDAAEEVVAEVPFAEIYAAADAGAGERLWRQCSACHRLEDGANGTGPYLHNIVGRDVGAAEGFNYSGALSEAAEVWTPENLNGFLENPRSYAPGTSMSYNGMRSLEDRANLIAWLETQGG